MLSLLSPRTHKCFATELQPLCSQLVLPLKFIPFQMRFLFIFVKTHAILVGPIFQSLKVSLNEWWLLLPRHLPLFPLWSHLQTQGGFSPIIRIFTKILNSTTGPSTNFQGTPFQGPLTVWLWAKHHIVLWSLEMRHFSQSVCPNCILPTCLQEYWGEHVKCLVKAKVQSIRNSSFIHWTSGFVTESIILAKHNLHLVNLSWGFPAIFFLVFHMLGKHFHKHLFHDFPQKCSETDSSAVSQIFIFVDRYNICPFPVT